MLLSFRQGIVQYEEEGFLLVNGATVSLVVNDTPTVVTIANGTADYLHVEHSSYPNAWPITGGVDQWLYWDIHSTHATRTFGVTFIEPVASAFAPASPVADQHWFDTTNNIMKVWQNNRWYNKLRVFACKLSGGSVATSISLNYPRFDGTQVGIATPVSAGSIMFDSISGKPLRAGDKFITTEDVISTVPLTKSDVKVESMIVSGEAQLPMSRYTAVYFSDFGRITHATDALMAGDYIPIGLLQSDCVSGDVIDVTMTGVITAYDWNWDIVGINAPLYINETGQLTPTKSLDGQRPIGYVVDTRSIVIGMTNIQSYGGAAGATLLSELSDVTLSTPTNGQFLKFDGIEWVNSAVPTPVTNLDGLTDVTLATPSTGQALLFNGTEWVNGDVASPVAPGYRQIYDATEGQTVFTLLNDYTPGGGQLSVYINGLKQTPTTYTETNATTFTLSQPAREADIVLAEISEVTPAYITPITVLDQLTDVTISAPTQDQVLKYVGGQWINDNLIIANALTDLTDVTITTPAADHYLRHNGTEWVNTPLNITPDAITSGNVALRVNDLTDSCALTVGTAQVMDITGTNLTLSGAASGIWSRLYGDVTANLIEHFFISTAADSAGNIYAAGGDDNPTASGSILLKLSPQGEVVWGKRITVNVDNWQVCDSVLVDAADNVYTISNINANAPQREYVLIHKFAPDGTLVWQREFADSTNAMFIHFETGCFRANGNLVLAGGKNDAGWASYSGVIGEITSTGSLVAVKSFVGIQTVSDVSCDPITNALYLATFWNTIPGDQTVIKVASDWSIPWSRTYDATNNNPGYQINGIVYHDGFVYASGQINGTGSVVSGGCLVIKLNATSGVAVWEKQITDADIQAWGDCIIADPDHPGTFYIGSGGRIVSTNTPLWMVYKIDTTGTVLGACHVNYVEGAYTDANQWWNWGHKWLAVRGDRVTVSGYTYGNTVYTAGVGSVISMPSTLVSGVAGAFHVTNTTSATGDVTTTTHTTLPVISDVAANCVVIAPTVTTTATTSVAETVFEIGRAPYNITLRDSSGTTGNVITQTNQGAAWQPLPPSPVMVIPATHSITTSAAAWATTTESSLVSNTGNDNVALGSGALHSNTTGVSNVAVGTGTLSDNTAGNNNIAIGQNCLLHNTTGAGNIAMGWWALINNSTGSSNLCIGGGMAQNTTGNDNTAIGSGALYLNTSGSSNTAIGCQPLFYNTTGTENVAVGYQSLYRNTTGTDNVALGRNALQLNVTGNHNIALGRDALMGALAGTHSYNIAVGHQALYSAYGATGNVAIGQDSQYSTYNGSDNVSLGRWSLRSNTGGNNNFAVGWNTLYSNTSGERNIAVGYQALRYRTNGTSNIALGHNSMYYTTTGNYNIAVGEDTMGSALNRGNYGVVVGFNAGYNLVGSTNVAIGKEALYSALAGGTGEDNVAIGNTALRSATTATKNTAIGALAMYSSTDASWCVAIGDWALTNATTGIYNTAVGANAGAAVTTGGSNTCFGYNAGGALTTGSLNVCIGAGAGKDAVANLTTQSNYVVLGNNSTTNANIKVAWTVTSDRRDKTDIVDIPVGLNLVKQLQPKQFKLMDRETQQPTTGDRYGFVAQDILSAEGSSPILVDNTDVDNLKLKESMLVPILVKAIQELTARIEHLESQL